MWRQPPFDRLTEGSRLSKLRTKSWRTRRICSPSTSSSVIQTRGDGIRPGNHATPPPRPRHRPLEPDRAGGQLRDRQWRVRTALHRRRQAREVQPDRRAACRGWHGRDFRLFRRGGIRNFSRPVALTCTRVQPLGAAWAFRWHGCSAWGRLPPRRPMPICS